MNNYSVNKAHWSFWLVSVFMLIWYLMGCVNFMVQLNPEMVASYREAEQAIIQGRPLWATVSFAVSVFGGAAGCLFLLLKRSAAFYFFILSLIGTVVAVAHSLSLDISFGIGEVIGIVLMPVLIAVFLVWYAKYSQNKGWVRVH